MRLTRKTINHHLSGSEAAGLVKNGYGKIEPTDIGELMLIAGRAS